MSKTLFVDFRGSGFWAYDVAAGIVAEEMVQVARQRQPMDGWLAQAIEGWEVTIDVSDYGLPLREDWKESQLVVVRNIIETVAERLAARDTLSSDSFRTDFRGADSFPVAPVVELALALRNLLGGDLEAPPRGAAWLYGAEGGRYPIAMRGHGSP